MKNVLKEEFDRIKAPDELKERTKKLMYDQMEKEQPSHVKDPVGEGTKRGKKQNKIVWGLAGAVLAAAALIILLLKPWKQDVFYVTPVSEEGYYARVELQDGLVQFVERGEAFDLSPNAGKVDTDASEDFAQEEEKVAFEQGGQIRVRESKEELPKASEEEYSEFAGEHFLVTVTEEATGRVFTAYIKRDSVLYTVTGEGVSQKQFLDYLRERFFYRKH